jgi:PAS domain S-box-containing protein
MVVGASKIARDITERKTAEKALAERTLQLALAERAALVGSLAYDPDTDRMQVSEGYAAIHGFPMGTTAITRAEWQAGVHPEDRERLEELRNHAFRERLDEYDVDYRIIRQGGEVRWIGARIFIFYGNDGRPRRVVGVNIDISERKRGEEHLRALNAELDHRVKNVLSTVRAIITQAPKSDSSLAEFVAGLDGRMTSLARTHELLSSERWRNVSLADIARRELEPYTAGTTDVGGPSVSLHPEAAQAVAMVLHELATNAAKHGAFSKRGGRVLLRWWWLQNGSQGRLAVEWQEVDGPPVDAPSRPSYGTAIIRELIPFELGGTVKLTFASEGIRCRMEIPGTWSDRDSSLTEGTPVLPSA